ncbi:MAG: tetratricopeptide repeat protein [Tannerellaceae bacterium]|nr:tetratricopeptide repeat protein [Tannerellaceae bacterium]
MRKNDVSKLLNRYLSAYEEGKEPYFDADEIDFLLDSFEESEEYTYYEEVLFLGLKLHPGSIELKIRECKLYMYKESYDKALKLTHKITETHNQDLDMIRLECLCALDSYQQALEYIEDLIRQNCDYLEPIFEFIVPILSDLEMNAEARDLINRGLILFPDNMILQDELCYLLELEGDFEEAIKLCNKLIDKNPYSNDYWFTLGRLYSMVGDFDKAIEAFDFALACDDSDVELKILKAYCLFMNENYQKAMDTYMEMALDEEALERIQPLMAECYIKLKQYEKGYEIIRELIRQDKQALDPATYINYIRCCVETDREQEAGDILLKAAEVFPENIRILSLLALTYLENGKEDLAMSITDKIFNQLEKDNEDVNQDLKTLFQKGQYFHFEGNLKKALQYYKKVTQINEDIPYMHLQMALAYFSLGDMELFGKHYRKTTHEDMMAYMKFTKLDLQEVKENSIPRHIPPEDLVKEFLSNKDNNN